MLFQQSHSHSFLWGPAFLMLAAPVLTLATALRAEEPAAKEQAAAEPAQAPASPVVSAQAKTPPENIPQPRPKHSVEEELERNEGGEIRFSFEAQPWLEVLVWLAKNSNLTLDWQEMPEGALNLMTQNSYTIDEARDLLNMHLATRGFTLLRRGEVLSLVKLDKLNAAIVPRVDESDLASRDEHEVVRVSFGLDWLVADDAAKELQPMLSPFGKLTPMSATNRLEALDTVANLREVRALLAREQSPPGESRLVVEFKLKHVRAEEIIEKLKTLVGESAAGRGLGSTRMRPFERMRAEAERARLQAEIAKNQGQQARKPTRSEPDVHLVVNDQENSILANAPPDKLAVIRQAVHALDVPQADDDRSRDAVTRMKIYRTKSIDPDALSEMVGNLIEMGKLAGSTKVQADDDSNTLIVYATPADHLVIASLVSQIDEDGRDVHIIPLHQLEPEYALQAIKAMLQGRAFGRRSRGEDSFRVEADYDRGRLLAWVNDTEYEQIKALLAKLGDDRGALAGAGNIRVLNLPQPSADKALETVQQIWPHLRANPLRVRSFEKVQVKKPKDDARRSALPTATDELAAANGFLNDDELLEEEDDDAVGADLLEDEDNENSPASTDDAGNLTSTSAESPARIAPDETPPRPSDQRPDVLITEGPAGQLILSSQDPAALDALEKLIEQIAPAQADYEVFHLKNASPFAIELTLKQIFTPDKPSNSSTSGLPATPKRQIQFISDVDTGTLLVQNATADQLEKIRQLVELYDQPETQDAELRRETKLYEVQYSRADAVAEVVKEVYRDLLSSNDKAFTRERKEGDSPSRGLGYGSNYGSKIPQFKGLLSIGVEENSNTLVVSAPSFLMDDVLKLIREVDERAQSHKIKVVTLKGLGAGPLRDVLSQIPGVTAEASAPRTAETKSGSAASAAAAGGAGQPTEWRRSLGQRSSSSARRERGESARRSEAIIRRSR